MHNPILALVLPSLLVVPAMGLLSRRRSNDSLGSEFRRKALHISVGLVALGFPLLLEDSVSIISALSLVLVWMLAVRFVPFLRTRFGCVLHAADRTSWGEIWFAIAIALLLLGGTSEPVLYVVPLLILTISDALAAIVGKAWPRGSLPGPLSGKTLAGSLAFCGSAFLIAMIGLWLGPEPGIGTAILISLLVAVLTALTEAVSSRGLDNLTVPAVAWLILVSTLHG